MIPLAVVCEFRAFWRKGESEDIRRDCCVYSIKISGICTIYDRGCFYKLIYTYIWNVSEYENCCSTTYKNLAFSVELPTFLITIANVCIVSNLGLLCLSPCLSLSPSLALPIWFSLSLPFFFLALPSLSFHLFLPPPSSPLSPFYLFTPPLQPLLFPYPLTPVFPNSLHVPFPHPTITPIARPPIPTFIPCTLLCVFLSHSRKLASKNFVIGNLYFPPLLYHSMCPFFS